MRQVHMKVLVEKGMTLADWEVFVQHFKETLDSLGPDIPEESKANAMQYILSTKADFSPATDAEIEAYKNAKAVAASAGRCPVMH